MTKIEAGERQYELVDGWGTLPDGWTWGQVAGVACDSQDQVHVYTRTEHPYMVFDAAGNLLHHDGENNFDLAHSLYIDSDRSPWRGTRLRRGVAALSPALAGVSRNHI